MMAQRYAKTPAEILDEDKNLTPLERYALNRLIMAEGLNYEIQQYKRQIQEIRARHIDDK